MTNPSDFTPQPPQGSGQPVQPTQPVPVQPAGNTVPPQTPGVIPIASGTPNTPNTPDAPNVRNKKTSKLAVFAIIVAAVFLLITFIGVNSWSLLAFFALLPVLLSGFAVYTTRKDGKAQGRVLAWVAVGITVVALIVGGVGVVRNGLEAKASHDAAEQAAKEAAKAKCDAYSWPTTDLASQLPKPESSKGKIEKDSSSAFYIKVCGTDATAYDNYVKALQEKGFTVDYFKSSSAFNAKKRRRYPVNIRYDSAGATPSWPFSSSPRTTLRLPARPGTAPRKTTMISGSGDASTGSSSDADFKAAMDSYESLMNEYADFMEKYNAGGHPASMAADYAKIMVKYNDAMKKLDAIDENSLTPEEQQYYIEVQTRVNQRLRFGGRLDGAIDARRVFSERFSIRKVRAVAEAKTNKGMPGTFPFRASP